MRTIQHMIEKMIRRDYFHCAHRDPLAHKAILFLTQPRAINSLPQGFEGEGACLHRKSG
jgi:hypothetical protein